MEGQHKKTTEVPFFFTSISIFPPRYSICSRSTS